MTITPPRRPPAGARGVIGWGEMHRAERDAADDDTAAHLPGALEALR